MNASTGNRVGVIVAADEINTAEPDQWLGWSGRPG